MALTNAFIVWLLVAAAFIVIAAILHKRARRRRDVAKRSTNHAS